MNHRFSQLRARLVGVGFFLIIPSRIAHAEDAVAQTLYNEAMALMEKGNYAKACPMLVESNRREEELGTRLALAYCYKGLGKLATAWALYIAAEDNAKQLEQADREKNARENITELEPRLPKLSVTISAKVAALPGVEVRHNGTVVNSPSWGTALPVDPGEHEIVVSAPGRSPVRQTRRLAEGALETVVIEDLPPGPSKSLVGPIVLGSVGLAGLVVGSVFGLQAFARRDDANPMCQADVTCTSYDHAKYNDARTAAHISTSTFIVGGVALAGAAVWLFAPSKASEKQNAARIWAIPTLAPTSSGLVVGGAF